MDSIYERRMMIVKDFFLKEIANIIVMLAKSKVEGFELFNSNDFAFSNPVFNIERSTAHMRMYNRFDSSKITLMTHNGMSPFGVINNSYLGFSSYPDYSIHISECCKNACDNDDTKDFFDQWDKIDDMVIEHVHKHSKEIWGKQMRRVFVHKSYVPVVQNDGEFPIRLNLKIQERYSGMIRTGKPYIQVYSSISDPSIFEHFWQRVCKKKCKFI
jgi:hypothetical protein